MDDITASIIVACQTDGAVAAVNKLKYSFAQLARQAFDFAKESIQVYSDLQEETQKFGLVFEKMHDQAKRNVKDLVDNFGQSELSARKMMSSTGDLLKGWGFADRDIVEMSGAVARLGADIASFSNYSGGATNATIALTKAMLGETEMAKMLGVAIKADSPEFRKLEKQALSTGVTIDKLGKSFKAETASQAKALAAFATMYQQKGYVLGDFKRNQDSIANSSRLLENRLLDLKTAVGDFLDSFINASGINKSFAEFAKGITDTINKNKVSWGLQIKTIFIEIEFGLKRTLAALQPVSNLLAASFKYLVAIGEMFAKGAFSEVIKAGLQDIMDSNPLLKLGQKVVNDIKKEQVKVRLRNEYGMPYNASDEDIALEQMRRVKEGLPLMDLSYEQNIYGGRLRKLAEDLKVNLPKVKFDFDIKAIEASLTKLQAEYEAAKKEAEESFRRRYVDEAEPKGKEDGKSKLADFGPSLSAELAQAMNKYRSTAQGAIDANSAEGWRLQTRRLTSADMGDPQKSSAESLKTVVKQGAETNAKLENLTRQVAALTSGGAKITVAARKY